MNYIVIDLEWNQSPNGKKEEVKELPFEIIELGAVKVNMDRRIVSEFKRLIKPQTYPELHYITKELVSLEERDLEKGETFKAVIKDFLEWCEEEYVFCTWGSSDLFELQRNMQYYGMYNPFKKPLVFYDIQKFFSILYEDGKSRTTLQHAAEFLKIQSGEEFHRAINDAIYTAQIMQHIDFEAVKKNYSIDCFRIPDNSEEEIYAVYETYSKYISRGFADKEDVIADKEVLSSRCYKCGRNCKRIVKWFSAYNKVHYGAFYCNQHGLMKGKIKIRQDYNGRYYAIKILKLTDETGLKRIRERKDMTAARRQVKRRK